LTFTKSDGATDSVNLTQYIDDTNLARLVSGTINSSTGIATFTRDDSSTFTVDFSALLDDTNDYVSSASFNALDGVLTLTRFGGTDVTVDLDGRYLESFTETDPTVPSHVKAITTTNISNWNTAHGWGNHAGLYLPISGKAADSELLDGIDSSNFFRTDGTYPNTDMNDTVEGYWHVASGSANLPVNSYGHRWDYDHVNNGQWVFQMYSPTSGDVDLWYRQKRNYSATSWQKVLTSANIGSYAVTSESDTLDSVADRGNVTNQTLISTNTSGLRVDSSSYARIELDSTDNWSYIRMQDQGTTTWDIACYNSGNLEWRPGGGSANRMLLSQSGNLTMESGTIYIGSNPVIHSGNIGSYALTSLPSHNHDDRYLVKGGSWNGSNMPGSRWGGFSSNGGEVAFQQDNPNNGQMSILVDGNFYAGENNGFWSLYSSNSYNSKAGMYANSSGYLILDAPSRVKVKNGSNSQMNINFDQIWTDSGNLHFQYSGSGNIDMNYGGGYTFSRTSLRAPIFYDSNDTGYYVDPSNITNLHTLQIGRNDAADNNRIDFYSTSAAGYSALRFKFAGNEDNTLHSFGRSWSSGFPYYSRGSFNFSGYYGVTFGAWNNPGAWIYNGGEAQFQSNVKSPIFYDSTSTGYYLDPASTSVLNDVNVNTLNATNMWEGDIYIEGDANTYYPVAWYGGSQAEVCEIEIYRNYSESAPSTWNTSSHRGGLVFRCSTNFGGWGGVAYDIQVQDFRESYTTMLGWMGHFANSRAFGFRLRGGGAIYHVRIKGRSVGPTVTYGTWDPGNNGTGLGTSTSLDTANIVRRRFASGSRLYSYDNLVLDHGGDHQTKSGILQSSSSLRAPIFYDSDNTGYYLNPASDGTSINVRGVIQNPSIWINDGDNYNNYNENIRLFNPSNNGPSVIAFSSTGTGGQPTTSILGYSDRLEQRFGANWQERVRNGYVEASGSYRAPIFYDSNNTGYYCDPASTSNFNTVYLNAQDWGGTITWNTGVNINVSGESSFDLLGSSAIWQVWTANNSQPSIYVTYAGQTEIGLAGNRGLKVHGNLTVNHSSTYGTGMDLTFSGSSATGMLIRNNTGSTKAAVSFFYSSAPQGARGTIMVSSTSTAYNTSSDYRLKENFEPITDGIDRVKLLQPKRFNFIGDDVTVDGFVAHETQEVVPESITGVKDEVDEDGNPVYQGIDQAKLVPLLTAALQEAIAKIESLESRIQVLENQ
jgi:hypothetical protein